MPITTGNAPKALGGVTTKPKGQKSGKKGPKTGKKGQK
jgi:hypothetical protein